MHHLEVFHCEVPSGEEIENYNAPCGVMADRPKGLGACRKVIGAWAVGAEVYYTHLCVNNMCISQGKHCRLCLFHTIPAELSLTIMHDTLLERIKRFELNHGYFEKKRQA